MTPLAEALSAIALGATFGFIVALVFSMTQASRLSRHVRRDARPPGIWRLIYLPMSYPEKLDPQGLAIRRSAVASRRLAAALFVTMLAAYALELAITGP